MRGLIFGSISVAVLASIACSTPNPAFEGGEGGEGGEGSASTSSGEQQSASAASEVSSEGAARCELHPLRPLEIHVARDGEPIDPLCDGGSQILMLPSGSSIFEGSTIIHPECVDDDATCLCTGTDVTIEIDGLAEFPAGVPSCGPIFLWSARSPTEPTGCEWGGLLMQREVDGQVLLPPYFIAARTRAVPPLGPGFVLELQPEEQDTQCEGDCDPDDPGRYQLDVVDQWIPADGLPHYVDVSFLPGGDPFTYLFDNRMSSVTESCEEQVAWTAVLVP